MNFLSVFDHLVGLALKGLNTIRQVLIDKLDMNLSAIKAITNFEIKLKEKKRKKSLSTYPNIYAHICTYIKQE